MIMNRYVQKLIKEQLNKFTVYFNDDEDDYNNNVVNYNYIHPYYYKILDGTITKDEIKELNFLVGVTSPKNKDELEKIVKFYSKNYPR